jgi:hypothetical protein
VVTSEEVIAIKGDGRWRDYEREGRSPTLVAIVNTKYIGDHHSGKDINQKFHVSRNVMKQDAGSIMARVRLLRVLAVRSGNVFGTIVMLYLAAVSVQISQDCIR